MNTPINPQTSPPLKQQKEVVLVNSFQGIDYFFISETAECSEETMSHKHMIARSLGDHFQVAPSEFRLISSPLDGSHYTMHQLVNNTLNTLEKESKQQQALLEKLHDDAELDFVFFL